MRKGKHGIPGSIAHPFRRSSHAHSKTGKQRIGGRQLILALLIFLCLGMMGCESNDICMYTKDAELWIHLLNEHGAPEKITENFVPDKETYNPTNPEHGSIRVNRLVSRAEHSLRIIYPTDIESETFKLVYKETGWGEASPVEIASDVIDYRVDSEIHRVIFQTKDGTLYRYNLNRVDLLAEHVQSFCATQKEADICYLLESKALYFQSEDAEPILIDEDVDVLHEIDVNSSVYYQKGDKLYIKKIGAETEYITGNVDEIAIDRENGWCYILCTRQGFCDAVFEQDAGVGPGDVSGHLMDVIFYNGSQQIPLSPLCEKDLVLRDAVGSGSICYIGLDVGAARKISAQDIEACQTERGCSRQEAIHMLWDEYLQQNRRYYLAHGEKVVYSWTVENSFIPCKDSTGDYFYYTIRENERTKLCRLSLQAEAPVTAIVNPNIQRETLHLYGSGTVPVYMTNARLAENDPINGWFGELWMNNESIAKNAYSHRILYDEERNVLFYMTEYDLNTESGTLMAYSNGKSSTIAERVYYYAITPEGNLVYLNDYNLERNIGRLWLYQEGEDRLLDEEVANVMQLD